MNGSVSTFNTMRAVEVSLHKQRLKNTKHYHQIVKQWKWLPPWITVQYPVQWARFYWEESHLGGYELTGNSVQLAGVLHFRSV